MNKTRSKVLILFNSSNGHLMRIAEAEKRGIEAAGGSADIYRIASFPPIVEVRDDKTLQDVNKTPIMEPPIMLEYDAILFGVSTAYGSSTTSDWRAFWDKTGGMWFRKCLFHKAAGIFVSAGTSASGLENIFTTAVTNFAHHGMYFVPLGHMYSLSFLDDMTEIHGGTLWGAGTFSGQDGMRSPSELELKIAEAQGFSFLKALRNLNTRFESVEECR